MRVTRMRDEVRAIGLTERLQLAVGFYFAPRNNAPAPTAAEVAEQFGVEESAIRMRIYRARKLVRRHHPTALPPKPRGRVRVFAEQLSTAFAGSI
jgi:transcription initiation factor TFIIIB Brf1 subunit/transcription initiation factor TFIIB